MASREELIAQSILNAQKRLKASPEMELSSVLGSPAFLSMPLSEKANIVKSYASIADEEPTIEGKRLALDVLRNGIDSGVSKGMGVVALTSIPYFTSDALKGVPMKETAQKLLRSTKTIAPWAMGIMGGYGAWARHKELKRQNDGTAYANELLKKIREAKTDEDRDLGVYSLLSAGNYINSGNAAALKNKSNIITAARGQVSNLTSQTISDTESQMQHESAMAHAANTAAEKNLDPAIFEAMAKRLSGN